MGEMLQDIWTPDVKAYQLADVLSGISPIRSVVNIGTGFADLVLLPIEQYRKDGRIVRGVQKGATSFAKTTAMEAIKLGAELATGTQVILERAEVLLGGASLPDRMTVQDEALMMTEDDLDGAEQLKLISRYAQQPENVGKGIESAYRSLSGNLRHAAQTILAVPMEVYERSGEGPAQAVVRAIPIAVFLKPMIGATEAMSKALLGLRNTLDPEGHSSMEDKYKQL